MDKEAFRQHETGRDIIDERPKDKFEEQAYWRRYEFLGEQIFFDNQIKLAEFKEKGFGIVLREGMEVENLSHAVDLGRVKGRGETNAEFDAISRELEKVVKFVPLDSNT